MKAILSTLILVSFGLLYLVTPKETSKKPIRYTDKISNSILLKEKTTDTACIKKMDFTGVVAMPQMSSNDDSCEFVIYGLESLVKLDIGHTGIHKLTLVEEASALKILNIHYTGIKELDFVKHMPSLERINITNTTIENLEPLINSNIKELVINHESTPEEVYKGMDELIKYVKKEKTVNKKHLN